MAEASSLRDLMRIRAHNRDYLDSLNATLGTALGFKQFTGQAVSDHPAVIVFVPRKINPKWIPAAQLIRKQLEGPDGLWCHLDVVEGGAPPPEEREEVPEGVDEVVERLRGWDDQLWGGSQITRWIDEENGVFVQGTLGAFAETRTTHDLGFLTNFFVASLPGSVLYHPYPDTTAVGVVDRALRYLPDEMAYGPLSDEPQTLVWMEAAFVRMDEARWTAGDVNCELMGIGEFGPVKPITLDDMAIVGQRVVRVGRGTGVRRGTVVAFAYECLDRDDLTVYTDLLIAGDDELPFSTSGDSGSLIVTDDDDRNPVGLLWAGEQKKLRTGHGQEHWSYGVALAPVLDALDVDLVPGPYLGSVPMSFMARQDVGVIKGIGPVLARRLKQAGARTVLELAALDPALVDPDIPGDRLAEFKQRALAVMHVRVGPASEPVWARPISDFMDEPGGYPELVEAREGLSGNVDEAFLQYVKVGDFAPHGRVKSYDDIEDQPVGVVEGVGPEHARWLAELGVDSVIGLAEEHPDDLWRHRGSLAYHGQFKERRSHYSWLHDQARAAVDARVDAAAFEPLLDMTVLEALRATPAELAELCGEPPVRCSTLRAGLGALRQAVDDDYLRFLKLRALT